MLELILCVASGIGSEVFRVRTLRLPSCVNCFSHPSSLHENGLAPVWITL